MFLVVIPWSILWKISYGWGSILNTQWDTEQFFNHGTNYVTVLAKLAYWTDKGLDRMQTTRSLTKRCRDFAKVEHISVTNNGAFRFASTYWCVYVKWNFLNLTVNTNLSTLKNSSNDSSILNDTYSTLCLRSWTYI